MLGKSLVAAKECLKVWVPDVLKIGKEVEICASAYTVSRQLSSYTYLIWDGVTQRRCFWFAGSTKGLKKLSIFASEMFSAGAIPAGVEQIETREMAIDMVW